MTQTKKYIFGYGSLMSPNEIRYTLGRPVEVIYPVRLRGWLRDWSVVCVNNSPRQYSLVETGLKPEYVAALNIRLPLAGEVASHPNGVLFEVNDSDIAKMDQREKHYRRLEVNDYIDNPPDGIIYAYSGLDQHLYFNKPSDRQVILPSNYLQVVEASAKVLGADFEADYHSSTLPASCPTDQCALVENTSIATPFGITV